MDARIRGPLLGCALFALYTMTAGRSIGWEDSAFFQLCHAVLGVPHGPGFPLYVLGGRVWVLALGPDMAWASNLFSAAAMAVSGVLMLEIMLLLARPARHPGEHANAGDPWTSAAAIAVVLGWGTVAAVWQQAVRTEVYPATVCLLLFSVYGVLRSRVLQESGEDRPAIRRLLMAAWLWGLAMAIHPLIALATGLPWLAYGAWPWRSRVWVLAGFALAMGAPLSLYLFPYLRGQVPGVWAWGSFHSLGSTLDYFLRRSAWSAVQSPDGGWWENIRGWGYSLSSIWPAGLWLPTLVALWWQRRHAGLIGCVAGSLALVIWAAPFNPLNLDLMGYFLPALAMFGVAVGIFIVRGVAFLRAQLPGLGERSRVGIGFFAMFLILGWPVAGVVGAGERPPAMNGAGELADVLVLSLPRNALVIATDDNVLGGLTYARQVRGERPDVRVVAAGALRYPFYRRRVMDELPADVRPDWDSDAFWSESEWADRVEAWLDRASNIRPVFSSYDVIPGMAPEKLMPAGYLYAWGKSAAEPPWEATLAFWEYAGATVTLDPLARELLSHWTFNFGSFALHRGRRDVGWKALLTAVRLSPDDPEIYYQLGRAFDRADRESDARAMYQAALELAPYRDRYRRALDPLPEQLASRP